MSSPASPGKQLTKKQQREAAKLALVSHFLRTRRARLAPLLGVRTNEPSRGSKYEPHQGAAERARRLRQRARS